MELTHTARSREGFALGAILAAEKINELPAGLHDFSELFETFF
ncbi:MAG: dihydrodipicolinate reductase C-terminal domain-containing protein [Bacteroidota bacterium]